MSSAEAASASASSLSQLERFREDLNAEASKLSGHTLLVVQSILESLQHVIDNEYTTKFTLPSATASASDTPTKGEVKQPAPVLLSRPQISIGTHNAAIGDPTYRPTLVRHQTTQPAPVSPRRTVTSTQLKTPVVALDSTSPRPSEASGVPAPIPFKATTMKESSSASHIPPATAGASATLKPNPGNVKVALKNVSAKFMSRLAMFEPALASDATPSNPAPTSSALPSPARGPPSRASSVIIEKSTVNQALSAADQTSETRATASESAIADPNHEENSITKKETENRSQSEHAVAPVAAPTKPEHAADESNNHKTSTDTQSETTDEPASKAPPVPEKPPKEAPPRPPRANTFKTIATQTVIPEKPPAAAQDPEPTSVEAPADFTSPRSKTSKRSNKKEKDSPPRKTPSPAPPDAVAAPTEAQQRFFVANEIVESERNYLRDLQIIIELYLQPLKANGIVSAPDLRTIFSQVEVIAKISETLLKKLQAAMDAHQSQGVEIKFGKPILELAEFMKSYSMYVNNYEQAMQVVQQYKRTNKKFVKFLAETMKNDRVRSHTIEDYLIVVIQRIPRYVLLLSEIVKLTPQGHEDHADLTKALGKVKDIADYVNTAKRRIELLQRGVDIQNQVGIKDVPAHRMFIDEAVFYDTSVAGVAEKDLPRNSYGLYLFSDIIVLAKFKGHDLVKVKIQDIIKSSFAEDAADNTCLALILDSSYQLYAANAETVTRIVKTWQESRATFEKDMLALELRRKASGAEEPTETAAAAAAASITSPERMKSPERARKSKKADKRETNDS
eukprot:TRINITY_DN7601_c0_g1_i1.p1 TRINITY_DN7601_c0_g1~~TRINITY_DN7601_c0_g1_i1.p1  ORF type:complete len:792 (+),score=182.74 TRINITY_DN7601_c0_g1_i1:88-2463(+)